jgi:hypothetical protein
VRRASPTLGLKDAVVTDPSERINRFLRDTEAVAKLIGRDPEEIRAALPDALDVDRQVDVMYMDLSVDRMIAALASWSFEPPEVLVEIELPESIIPEGIPVSLREAQAKHKNEIWEVHRNDADPHPSNPHAHCEEHALKMHLGTGELFRKRKLVGKLAVKDFLALRKKLGELLPGVVFPALAV